MSVGLTREGFSVDQVRADGRPQRKLVAEWVVPGDLVSVIAYGENNAVLLVNRSRDRNAFDGWRLPGGWVEGGDTPLEAAIAGLYADTGFRAARWSWSGTTPQSEAIRRFVHHFEARGMKFDPEGKGFDANALAYWFDFEEAIQMALDGSISDQLSALEILRSAN